MTSTEYRDLIAALSLSQAGAARLLGVDERTSRRWALGEREVPPPVQRFLLFLFESGWSPAEALNLIKPHLAA